MILFCVLRFCIFARITTCALVQKVVSSNLQLINVFKVVGNLKFLSMLQRNIPKTVLSYRILMKKCLLNLWSLLILVIYCFLVDHHKILLKLL